MSVLVILEQQGGKWNRMSWETLAAGQHFGAELGQPLEAAVVGHGIAALAAEAATKKVAKVYAVEHELLEAYTADGYAAAVEQLVRKVNPHPGSLPAYLSGPGFCAEDRHAFFASAGQRRHHGPNRFRLAHLRAAVVPGQAGWRRTGNGRRALLCFATSGRLES